MRTVYRKRLSSTEAKRHYVHIECDALTKMFPPIEKPFKLRIGKKEFQVKINDYFQIHATEFKDYIDFREGNVFVFKKAPDGSFTLKEGSSMKEIYKKRLNPTEAKRRYVYIERGIARKLFPLAGKPFKLRIGKKEFQVKMDNHSRILGTLFKEYVDFKEGNVFVFERVSDGYFALSGRK